MRGHDARRARLRRGILFGSCEIGADQEELPLHSREESRQILIPHGGASHAEMGVELIDRAVGLHASALLWHARAGAQIGFAGIATAGVDRHRYSLRAAGGRGSRPAHAGNRCASMGCRAGARPRLRTSNHFRPQWILANGDGRAVALHMLAIRARRVALLPGG